MQFLFRPVAPFYISQKFGENKACVKIGDTSKTIFCDGHNPPVGYKSVYSRMNGHNGLDIPAKRYTPIYSAQDGIVYNIVQEKERGLGLEIITKNKFYCKETQSNEHFKVHYWHNFAHNVDLGDEVHIGDLIAWADNTGYSSGDHLHFAIKPVKVNWKKDGTIRSISNILQDNGYFGAVDPEPYLRSENAVRLQGLKSLSKRLLWAITR